MPGYISEVSYGGDATADFVKVVVPLGTDVSSYSIVLYRGARFHGAFSFGALRTSVDGSDVYLLNRSTNPQFDGIASDYGVAVIDDNGKVIQFLSFGRTLTASDGLAAGKSSTNVGTVAGSDTLKSDNGGISYRVHCAHFSASIPGFTPGTLILTPNGEVPVESLRTGEQVVTIDRGNQPIRYILRSKVIGLPIPDSRRPIFFPYGSLGPGLPKRDLTVFGLHRILLSWKEVQKLHNSADVLAPSKGLLTLPGVRVKQGIRCVQSIQLLLDRHEVIYAEGVPAESLYPASEELRKLSRGDRLDLYRAVPKLLLGVEAAIGAPARGLLAVQQTQRLARAYQKRMKTEAMKWDVDLAMERYETERLVNGGSRPTALGRTA